MDPIFLFIVSIALGRYPLVLFHELGHYIAGRALGMKLYYLQLGPLGLFVCENGETAKAEAGRAIADLRREHKIITPNIQAEIDWNNEIVHAAGTSW